MKELKEFIAWLEEYAIDEGHAVIGTTAVIYNLKKILSSLEEEHKEEIIRSKINGASHILNS